MMNKYGDQLRARVWRLGFCKGMETGSGTGAWNTKCSIGLETVVSILWNKMPGPYAHIEYSM